MSTCVRIVRLATLCLAIAGCSGYRAAGHAPGTPGSQANPEFELPTRPGSLVRVHLADGTSVEGRLLAVSDTEVRLSEPAPGAEMVSVPRAEIAGLEPVSAHPAVLVTTFAVAVVAVFGYLLQHGGW